MRFHFLQFQSAHALSAAGHTLNLRRRRVIVGCALAIGVVLLANLSPVAAVTEDDPAITRIEEDWQVDVATPNSSEFAPQITTVISPRSNLDHSYAVFELNHATQPGFEPGGLQMQCWYGNNFICASRHMQAASLNTPDETITFTMTMTLADHWLKFEVENGSSPTWGAFGKGLNGNLKQWWYSSLDNLNQYSPEHSVANSRVGFASHRVKKLQLKSVRYYSGETLVQTDSTPKIVWEHTSQE